MHALSEVLQSAAEGRFPAVDGLAEVHPPDDSGTYAVVEFTGHSFVLTTRPPAEVVDRGADGFGGATQPDLLRWLAGPGGVIGTLDAVLVARGTGSGPTVAGLDARDDLDAHPRVVRARAHRRDVRVFGDERGLVTLGLGLAGRLEVSVELLAATEPSSGAGRELIRAALGRVPSGAFVWAQVSPGNAASLRAFLAAGFTPVAAEVLFRPRAAS